MWSEGLVSRFTNLDEAFATYQDMVNDAIDAALAELKQDVKVYPCHCFSDPHGYFRSEIYPTYKAGRAGTNKPVGYWALCSRIMSEFRGFQWPRLEADDIIGILATRYPTESLIISGDKDLKTIPGPHYDFLHKSFQNISTEEAEHNFLLQCIMGDSTDGYSGIHGVGIKTAEKILNKDGWSWDTVVKAYTDKGLTAADALQNARCAYILHDGDYKPEEGVVQLWRP